MKTRELIERAAAGRGLKLQHDIAFNVNAELLLKRGRPAVGEIERFLSDWGTDDQWLLKGPATQSHGLAAVLGVYLRLSKDFERAARLMLSLRYPLRQEFLRMVAVQFCHAKPQRVLPAPLADAVNHLRLYGNQTERQIASRLVENLPSKRAINPRKLPARAA